MASRVDIAALEGRRLLRPAASLIGLAALGILGSWPAPACKEDLPAPTLIPSGVGTFWVYADSTITDGAVSVSIDTVAVTGMRSDAGRSWWALSGRSPAMSELMPEYMVHGDTVFIHRPTRTGSLAVGPILIPAREEPATFWAQIAGDLEESRRAARVRKPISVPAGDFSSYILFSTESVLQKKAFCVVPGVGIIDAHIQYETLSEPKTRVLHSVLLSYSLPSGGSRNR